MKKIIAFALLTSLGLGCTANFKEMNQDPYGVTHEQRLTTPIGSSELQDQNIWILPNQENGWQMNMDLPGIYSRYCAASHFVQDYNTYTPRTGWVDYIFDDTFKHLYPDFNAIRIYAKEDINQPAYAVALISRAAISLRLSDIFGPIPYSAVNGIDLNVAFDSQREVYLNILKDLKAATEALDKIPISYDLYAPYDNIYKGQMPAWARYGRSLMLRMAVRMAKQEPALAKEYAEYAVQKGVISKNDENALVATLDNPCYKVAVSWNDSRVGADIVMYMSAYNDPRSLKYFSAIETRLGEPFGYRLGAPTAINKSDSKYDYSVPNIQKDSPIVLFSAAESSFLQAEAVLNGWNMGGRTAEELYRQGVAQSFEQWGVALSHLEHYLQSTDKVQGFMDEKDPSLNSTDFSSHITVNWADAEGDKEKQLSKIITQKWIAMFPYNTIEAWTEWRRTGYPNLLPNPNNQSGGAVQPITQVDGKDVGGMRRLKFSQTSVQQNGQNVQAAIASLGGPDAYSTNLWWAK